MGGYVSNVTMSALESFILISTNNVGEAVIKALLYSAISRLRIMVLICQFEPLITVLLCVHVHMCVCVCEIFRWP